jgi:hypothetical protein
MNVLAKIVLSLRRNKVRFVTAITAHIPLRARVRP